MVITIDKDVTHHTLIITKHTMYSHIQRIEYKDTKESRMERAFD